MNRYEELQAKLSGQPSTWLVTGAAGFIGSHLVESLLHLNQRVVALDSFLSGSAHNLESVRQAVGSAAWGNLRLLRGDIQSLDLCVTACKGVDYVLHQAALGSVPRSIDDPIRSHRINVDGHVNMLVAARDAGVRRFVYASSSSVYGDHPDLPKIEERTGRPLSPYALTKLACELYAGVFARCYGVPVVGLRYFNVFGPRQSPTGPYAAVIPRWIGQMLRGEQCAIHGDGESSRDFCYVQNVVQANLLAARVDDPDALNEVYNIACGERTTLNELFTHLRNALAERRPEVGASTAAHADLRTGDVPHSHADIGKAQRLLGYLPQFDLREGLRLTSAWFAAEAAAGHDAALKALNQTIRMGR